MKRYSCARESRRSKMCTTRSPLFEKALRASEARYRRLFESAKDGILILAADSGQIQDANPFLTDMLGYSWEELLGKELWKLVSLKTSGPLRPPLPCYSGRGTSVMKTCPSSQAAVGSPMWSL